MSADGGKSPVVGGFELEFLVLSMDENVVNLFEDLARCLSIHQANAPSLGHELGDTVMVWGDLVQFQDQVGTLLSCLLELGSKFPGVGQVSLLAGVEQGRIDLIKLLEDLLSRSAGVLCRRGREARADQR